MVVVEPCSEVRLGRGIPSTDIERAAALQCGARVPTPPVPNQNLHFF